MRNRLLLAFISLLGLTSCLKDSPAYQEVASATALNAVPGSHSLIIGLDQNQLNHQVYGERFAYKDILPYKAAYPNRRHVRVFDPMSIVDPKPLAEAYVEFAAGNYYTLYLVGNDTKEIIYTQDDLSIPDEGKAKIRFINLSPDASALDLVYSNAADSVLATNKAFKTYTAFKEVSTGQNLSFHIKDHASGRVMKSFTFNPQSGRVYTIWARGLTALSADPKVTFEEGIITH